MVFLECMESTAKFHVGVNNLSRNLLQLRLYKFSRETASTKLKNYHKIKIFIQHLTKRNANSRRTAQSPDKSIAKNLSKFTIPFTAK